MIKKTFVFSIFFATSMLVSSLDQPTEEVLEKIDKLTEKRTDKKSAIKTAFKKNLPTQKNGSAPVAKNPIKKMTAKEKALLDKRKRLLKEEYIKKQADAHEERKLLYPIAA